MIFQNILDKWANISFTHFCGSAYPCYSPALSSCLTRSLALYQITGKTPIMLCFQFSSVYPGLSLVFYRCYVENCDSDSSSQFSPIWLNNTVPWNDDNTPDQCKRYNYTWANLEECQTIEAPIDSEMMCDRWVYDKSQFQSTIVTDVTIVNHFASSR